MTNRKARTRRPQTQKPNRHVARVQDLRSGSRTSRHVVQTEDRDVRKYGIRAILKNEG